MRSRQAETRSNSRSAAPVAVRNSRLRNASAVANSASSAVIRVGMGVARVSVATQARDRAVRAADRVVLAADRAADRGFDEAELGRVKAQLKMGLLAALESSGARAEQLARHSLFCGRVLSTAELVERIEEVDTADLQNLLQKILTSPLSLATVGPVANLARFDAVAGKFAVPASRAA